MSSSYTLVPLRLVWMLLFITGITTLSYCQSAEEAYDEELPEDEMLYARGLYLTFQDFITNNPAPPELIQTTANPHSRDFYLHLLREREITIKSADATYIVARRDVWGYSDGKAIHMNHARFPKVAGDYVGWSPKDDAEHPFSPITEMGTISLIYYVKERQPMPGIVGFTARVGTSSGRSGRRSNEAEFLLDTRDGKIYHSTLEIFQTLIQDDPEIANEFKRSREDKDIRLYIYLRKYNRAHPLSSR